MMGEELEARELSNGRLVTYLVEEFAKGYTMDIFEPSGSDGYMVERQDLSYMPKAYKSKTLNDFKWDAYNGEDTYMARRIVDGMINKYDMIIQSGRGLYIYSETPGTGKTMLACAIANELLKTRDMRVKFITAPKYAELKFEDRGEFMESSLLILDDWGSQSERQEWMVEALFKLIDYRYEHILPTIITSNKAPGESTKDDRSISRIKATAMQVKLPEYSVRDERANEYTKSFIAELLRD